jgi:branched-chain amino acid transport system substrate-binding protein
MSQRKKKEGQKGWTRREFIKNLGKGTAVVGAASLFPRIVKPARAAKRDYILIGRPNPVSGGMAGFGEATPWVDNRAIDVINKRGGIYVKELDKSLPIKIKIVDTESSPVKAAEVASKLILGDKIDLMVVLHGPDTTTPVSGVCERFKIPCISVDTPVEAWLPGGPYKWSYHVCWTVDALTDLFIGMWDEYADKTNRVVGGLWPNDPDGMAWVKIFGEKLPPKGYKIVDPGRFPYGMADFTSAINLFKKEKVEILSGVVIPPDWTTAWRQCHQQGFSPKIATIAKAVLFPPALEALGGNLPNGLTTEIWFSPNHPFKSSLTGESAKDICDAWEKATGKQYNQPLGPKHTAWEIVYDVFKRAQTLEKDGIREAIAKTDMHTMWGGPTKYNEQHYSTTPLVGGQWVKGKKWPWDLEIVYNKAHPEITKTAEMIFPLPR